uniref:Major capsid protein VP1 n=1 Tax=Murine polyomavirus (strain Crawford small-plaque) TaxID=10637 RepID=VP1_POVMC|nr:RecName: Full=Major capsid protein VP1; AltName: Full=Major structural protein VP1 [Mouse polyomavirus (strain Crawford small-plaque)]
MAPKRKSGVSKCETKCTKACPRPAPVPKLLIKGGMEVLDLVTGPDSVTEIEAFLNPRMGQPPTPESLTEGGQYYGWSRGINLATSDTDDSPGNNTLPTWSMAKLQLPMLNEDLTCDTLQMWEAVSVKTEVVGSGSLLDVHGFNKPTDTVNTKGISTPVEGSQYHVFAVGGEPLDLQGLVTDARTKYKEEGVVTIKTITKKDMVNKDQVLNPISKAKLDKDGMYPVEIWHPDPAKNENTRYFGNYTGGTTAPPVLQFTNTLTTVLLDENGVGPLCKGEGVYLSCVDIMGWRITRNYDVHHWRGLPRYFKITLRKRWVKNPYPMASLISSLFNNMLPQVQGQPMEGENTQVEEVRVYDGTEPVPGDPDMTRYVDRFGKTKTVFPGN